jgi:hypothetical protein
MPVYLRNFYFQKLLEVKKIEEKETQKIKSKARQRASK